MEYFRGYWSQIGLITDEMVASMYLEKYSTMLSQHTNQVFPIVVPAGEASKNRESKAEIEDLLFEKKFDRRSLIVALGGGMVGDLAGFVAATFLRGVDFINIPTTLLAMVDASIGGKCGINTDHGKNLIGTIYQPKNVLVCDEFLDSLNRHEIKCGMAEIVKAALIADEDLFQMIEDRAHPCELIKPARKIKKGIVSRDLFEKGERRILNFGHTVGHAVEKLSSYKFSHGACVWFGLLVESKISQMRNMITNKEFERIASLLLREDLRFEYQFFDSEAIYQAMEKDKKNEEQQIRMVLIEDIGKAAALGGEYCSQIKKKELLDALLVIEELFCEVYN